MTTHSAIALFILYVLGFLFSLGFWLEDVEGMEFFAPFLRALLWPLLIFYLAFPLGCTAARVTKMLTGPL